MGELNISGSDGPEVKVGRVVLIHDDHAEGGKPAIIVEVIDHKRVLVEGPSADASQAVARQEIPLSHCLLSKIVVPKLPRGARHATVKKFWENFEVDAKWKGTNWYKKRMQWEARKSLTDLDRFKLMILMKRRRFEYRKAHAKVRASA